MKTITKLGWFSWEQLSKRDIQSLFLTVYPKNKIILKIILKNFHSINQPNTFLKNFLPFWMQVLDKQSPRCSTCGNFTGQEAGQLFRMRELVNGAELEREVLYQTMRNPFRRVGTGASGEVLRPRRAVRE
jgi:hypothetical protein